MNSKFIANSTTRAVHVVEAFGAGVGYSVSQIYSAYDHTDECYVVHGQRDFNSALAKRAEGVAFVPWCATRNLSLSGDLKAFFQLIKILREIKPTFVHAHSSKAGVHARVATFLLGIPCVYTPHSYAFLRLDVSPFSRFIYKTIERVLAPLALTMACGLEEFVYARKFSKNSVVVENGVDVERFKPPVIQQEPTGRLTFLCVGRISPQKDYPLFEAISRLPECQDHDFVWVSGDGGEDVSVSKNLTIYGTRKPDEMVALYQAADVFVSTSLWEGLSRAALEAAASGLPLLLRDCPGNRELLFRLPLAKSFTDIHSFQIALREILSDFVAIRHLGRANALFAKEYYSSSDVQKRVLSIYSSLIFERKMRGMI